MKIENGQLITTITIPADANIEDYILDFITEENEIFNDSITKVKLNISNKKNITINTEEAESSTNRHTLDEAIKLVDNYGTIEILSPLSNQNITLDKSVTIKGDITLTDCQIINNADQVLIKGLTFENENFTSNIIINNGNMSIDECVFNNSKQSAVLTNNKILITNTTFTNNTSSNGGAIYISNQNYSTEIQKCTFNNNNASLNGGCIYSNKGNDVSIEYCEFSNNNNAYISGSCISVNGNTYLSSNIFYNNDGKEEISLINGTIEMDKNIFSGNIRTLRIYAGVVDADLNYWGYNNINDIYNNNDTISLNNWLISRCEVYNKENINNTETFAVGIIDRYMNQLEEEITTIKAIDLPFPVSIGSQKTTLNKEFKVSPPFIMRIGQEELMGD